MELKTIENENNDKASDMTARASTATLAPSPSSATARHHEHADHEAAETKPDQDRNILSCKPPNMITPATTATVIATPTPT